VRIGLLGAVELRDADGGLVPVRGIRLRALLLRLALDPDRAVPADRLIDDLWGAELPEDPVAALHSCVSRLRRALDDAGAPGRAALRSEPAGYRLDSRSLRIDGAEFEQGATAGRDALRAGDPSSAATLLRTVLALWRGPACADVAGWSFAVAPAARLESLRLAALEDRIDADLALSSTAPADVPTALVAELESLSAAHPLREGLAARLLLALCRDGRRNEALARYATIRRSLANELGTEPGPELHAAHLVALRGGGPSINRSPAPAPARGNLPTPLTGLIGRAPELRVLDALLGSGRLTTLVGPGGAGKTRLAIEAAHRQTGSGVRDGVWLVELAGVAPGGVAAAVLGALARPTVETLPGRAADDAVQALGDALTGRRLVLVLDNCEHLVADVAAVLVGVLPKAPGVRVLATSREALGVTGERLCPVPPLLVDGEPVDGHDADTAPAVLLFAERARAARPGFVLDEGSLAEVRAVCRALDGLPLAIELAAARLRTLPLAELAARLTERVQPQERSGPLAVLARGSRGGSERHRTLRAVLDWSWELLGDAERTVLRRMSVFAGPASDGMIAAVVASPRETPDVGDALDVLEDLVGKSLVVAASHSGGVRYRLLETVRAYAAEQMTASGEAEQIRAAHTAQYLRLAEDLEPRLRTGDQLAALVTLRAAGPDLDAATASALTEGAPGVAVRLVAARVWGWWLTGQRRESRWWADAVLSAATSTGGSAQAEVPTAYGLCVLASMTGGGPVDADGIAGLDHPAAALAPAWMAGARDGEDRTAVMLKTADRFADHPDLWCRAAARLIRGHARWDQSRAEEAEVEFHAATDGFRGTGDRWGLVLALSSLAMTAETEDSDVVSAERALVGLREAQRCATELDGHNEVPELFVRIAALCGRTGRYDEGIAALDSAGDLAMVETDRLLQARIAHGRGELDRRAGALADAAGHGYEALRLLGERGPGEFAPAPSVARFEAQLRSCLGRIEAARSRDGQAAELHIAALRLAAGTGDAPLRAELLERFAAFAGGTGQARLAVAALGAAAVLRRRPTDGAATAVSALGDRYQEIIGPDAYAAALAAGATRPDPEAWLVEELTRTTTYEADAAPSSAR
jgi:predicted ATPase/DNA-binding SARP family transcriptional activator